MQVLPITLSRRQNIVMVSATIRVMRRSQQGFEIEQRARCVAHALLYSRL